MAANTNKVILTGRLAQDPDVRYTQTGKAVTTFTLAVNRFGGQNGQNEADFIPVVTWERLAEVCGNNLVKGRRVLVEGRLQIRSYDDNTGQRRRIAEVIAQSIEFLDSVTKQNQAEAADFGSLGEELPEEEISF